MRKALCVSLWVAVALAGCVEIQDSDSGSKRRGNELARLEQMAQRTGGTQRQEPSERKKPADAAPLRAVEGGKSATWTIIVADYLGPAGAADAQQAQQVFSQDPALAGLFMTTQGQNTLLCYGRYTSPDDKQAQADLARLKDMAANNRLPSRVMLLSPIPDASSLQAGDPMDLRSMIGRASYTLQVATYEGDGREKAAQEAAAILRKDGDEAYYYHSPVRSVVTVGAFSDDECRVPAGQSQVVLSPRIRALQAKYPYNLINGMEYRTINPDGSKTPQPSFLVAMPTE